MTAAWIVKTYKAAEGNELWTEWAVEDDDGRPICDGVMTERIAHLIAAGPVLLDALKGVIASADFAIDGGRLEAALQAIASAEGRKP